jgi:hypothetical protein
MSIDRIMSDIKFRGVARTNRFRVRINSPKKLQLNHGIADKLSKPNKKIGEFLDKGITTALNSFNNRSLELSCERATIPAKSYLTTEVPFSYGPTRRMPYNVLFNEISLTFRVSRNFEEKKFFDDWQNAIMDPFTHELNYWDEYTTEVEIIQEDDGKPFFGLFEGDLATEISRTFGSGNDVYALKLNEAYPVNVTDLNLDHEEQSTYHKLTVNFAFRKWTAASFGEPPEKDDSFIGQVKSTADRIFSDHNPFQTGPF